MTDTLFADVSEFQVPVNDSYPYRVLSIRVCDGTYRDHNFAANYAWMSVLLYPGNMRTVGALIFSGICHRFPKLNFVSVESGVG